MHMQAKTQPICEPYGEIDEEFRWSKASRKSGLPQELKMDYVGLLRPKCFFQNTGLVGGKISGT